MRQTENQLTKVWKKVWVGIFTSHPDMENLVTLTGQNIGFDHIRQVELVQHPTEIELVKVSVASLFAGTTGYWDEWSTRHNVYKRALQLGLTLCPDEIPYQLLLQLDEEDLSREISPSLKKMGILSVPSVHLATRLVTTKNRGADLLYTYLSSNGSQVKIGLEPIDPYFGESFDYGMDGGPRHYTGQLGWGAESSWIFAKPCG